MKSFHVPVMVAAAALFVIAGSAEARPKYAQKEGQKCDFCHVRPGGPRNFRGLYYNANNLSFEKFDEEFESKAAGVKSGSLAGEALPQNAAYPNVKLPPVWRYTMKDIDGKNVNLGRYSGKVALIVNVATFCGNTPQYASLQKLYDKYKSQGLVILGFPANEFGKQEPGTDKEIKEFCTSKYNVTFPMFSKIVVKGEGIAPLYKFLTDKEINVKTGGDIDWNFAKFLVGADGQIVGRFSARTKPDTDQVVSAIEAALKATAKSN